MYIHGRTKYIRDKQFCLHLCKCLWLNLFQPLSKKKKVIATIHKHSEAKIDKFIKDYSQCLEQTFTEKKTFNILGKINININERSSQVVNYLNTTKSNGVFQLITTPTKVTDSTATVIDHLFNNDKILKLCT